VPLSRFVLRGFGFVHHSIAILYHEVPNPNLTIRNFFIAVGGGSPDGANPHMSQGALMSKMVDRRKAMHAQMSEEFPSLLQKGISVSNHKLGSGDFGCVYEVRQPWPPFPRPRFRERV
jgi:hypothetical protein